MARDRLADAADTRAIRSSQFVKEVSQVLSELALGNSLRDHHLGCERTPPFSGGVDDPVLADTVYDESSSENVEPQAAGSPCRLTGSCLDL